MLEFTYLCSLIRLELHVPLFDNAKQENNFARESNLWTGSNVLSPDTETIRAFERSKSFPSSVEVERCFLRPNLTLDREGVLISENERALLPVPRFRRRKLPWRWCWWVQNLSWPVVWGSFSASSFRDRLWYKLNITGKKPMRQLTGHRTLVNWRSLPKEVPVLFFHPICITGFLCCSTLLNPHKDGYLFLASHKPCQILRWQADFQ